MTSPSKILVTGATGYIGGRLIPLLLQRNDEVRCMVRDPERLVGRGWTDQVDVAKADALDPESLDEALSGIDTAYYLIHSMRGGEDFEERDREAARNFSEACRRQGVRHIIYLGGLGSDDPNASTHLRSRREVGEVLREAGVTVTELRAGVVVGSGSLGFELVRYLTERLPILLCPKWVFTRTQPIAVRDLLTYLVAVHEREEVQGRILPVGGADALSYGDMMLGYAKARGLPRRLVPVPVLSPGLSSHWVHFVTPVPRTIARPLILGLRDESVVDDDVARRLMPDIEPVGYDVAVRRALDKLRADTVETTWASSLSSSQGRNAAARLSTREGMIVEQREMVVDATPHEVFAAFSRLGGDFGWLTFEWAWNVRGALDRLVGGVGMRRGRRHPTELRVGDPLDFWRVEDVVPDQRIRLRAEMKVPGRAWLEFEGTRDDDGRTRLRQSAYFAPHGLWGLVYWYGLYPIHTLIFGRMIAALARAAENEGPAAHESVAHG